MNGTSCWYAYDWRKAELSDIRVEFSPLLSLHPYPKAEVLSISLCARQRGVVSCLALGQRHCRWQWARVAELTQMLSVSLVG